VDKCCLRKGYSCGQRQAALFQLDHSDTWLLWDLDSHWLYMGLLGSWDAHASHANQTPDLITNCIPNPYTQHYYHNTNTIPKDWPWPQTLTVTLALVLNQNLALTLFLTLTLILTLTSFYSSCALMYLLVSLYLKVSVYLYISVCAWCLCMCLHVLNGL
jgi:hypothetical protein